jgi:hypothetical protein
VRTAALGRLECGTLMGVRDERPGAGGSEGRDEPHQDVPHQPAWRSRMIARSSPGSFAAWLLCVALVTSGCAGPLPSGAPAWPWLGGDLPARTHSAGTPRPSVAPASAAPAVAAQLPGLGPNASSPGVAARLPELVAGASGLGPPAWVQPGTRLSYYGAAASVAQSSYTYVEDPTGTWEDPTTGKRYRRTDESGEDMPTAAGEAFTQTDVLAVEGTDVVVSTTLYSIDLLARQFTLTPMGGARTAGAAVDGAWVNPDLLRQVEASGYGDLQVLRGDYVLDGVSYRALSFVSNAAGAYQASTYDTASGLLLRTNTSTEGAGAPVHGPLDNPQGNVQLSNTRLVGVRQRTLPGIDAAAPDWVAAGPTLSYRGECTIINPLDPGSGPWVYPMQMTVTLGEGGRTWATFASHTVIDLGGSPQPTDATGVTGSTGLYWYDPATLSTLGAGQLLDEDPVTGARVTVAAADAGGSGSVVTLVTEMNGVTLRLGYDVGSGVLGSLEITQSVTGSTIRLQLVSSGGPG